MGACAVLIYTGRRECDIYLIWSFPLIIRHKQRDNILIFEEKSSTEGQRIVDRLSENVYNRHYYF
jgi:hypothetical protein